MNWIVPALSAGGEVFGMQTTVVNPPAAAAREPVATVSLWVWPGSRKWTWMSTRPGQATQPPGVDLPGPLAHGCGQGGHDPPVPDENASDFVPPGGGVDHAGIGNPEGWHGERLFGARDSLFEAAAGAEVKDGHADGDAVGHLLEDHAARAVGQLAVDLDAAVDRARGA